MIIIGNGRLITRNAAEPYYENGAVVTENELIKETGTTAEMRLKYPDAEFVYIKPSAEIGDFWNGTLDFTPRGAKVRMNLGYADAKRVLEYSDKDMSDEGVRGAYRITEQSDYDRIIFEYRKENIENQVNDDMDKINSLINRFM